MSRRLRALAFFAAIAAFGGVASVGACPAPEIEVEGMEDELPTFSTADLPVTITVAGTGWTCAGVNAGCGGGEAEEAYDEVVLTVAGPGGEDVGGELARVEPNDDDGTFSTEVTIDGLEPGTYDLVARATQEGFSHRVPLRIKR